ncbi:MAG TPA: hypothetical protein VFX85_09420 [Solirubrobacterales bacterium]|nr:hypothetical protein [Solirubrobacterales bacterium]
MRRRLLTRKRSRAARRGEAYIAAYEFPAHIERRVRRRFPELDDAGWALVEQGLREWFVCCAWRGRTVLGMPSRLVDEAWHEFLLDSLAYMSFCQEAFGEYLHHTPDEAMVMPMGDALGDTVRAWDRSDMGAQRKSVLWDLDRRLGIERPLGIAEPAIVSARTRSPYPLATGWACAGFTGALAGGGDEGGDGEGGGEGGDSGGGDSGGGGCGGGCGGGSS